MNAQGLHDVAVLAFDGVVPFDLSTPCEVFTRARGLSGEAIYEVSVCAERPLVRCEPFDIHVRWDLDRLASADTVIIPGMCTVGDLPPKQVLDAILTAASRGARIASICTGAFVLAATGLLDHQRVTTHWRAADALSLMHPKIQVDPSVLYVDNGNLLTSAGASAGMDLCVHMIRSDFGAAVAADAAKLSVMPLERAGGQSQFITHEPPGSAGSLAPLLDWINVNLKQPLSLDGLAAQHGTTKRTLNRRFVEQVGVTPLQWILAARVRRAQALLETTDVSVDRVAEEVGFGTATSLRTHFSRVLGVAPLAYKSAFFSKR